MSDAQDVAVEQRAQAYIEGGKLRCILHLERTAYSFEGYLVVHLFHRHQTQHRLGLGPLDAQQVGNFAAHRVLDAVGGALDESVTIFLEQIARLDAPEGQLGTHAGGIGHVEQGGDQARADPNQLLIGVRYDDIDELVHQLAPRERYLLCTARCGRNRCHVLVLLICTEEYVHAYPKRILAQNCHMAIDKMPFSEIYFLTGRTY